MSNNQFLKYLAALGEILLNLVNLLRRYFLSKTVSFFLGHRIKKKFSNLEEQKNQLIYGSNGCDFKSHDGYLVLFLRKTLCDKFFLIGCQRAVEMGWDRVGPESEVVSVQLLASPGFIKPAVASKNYFRMEAYSKKRGPLLQLIPYI